MNRKAKVTIFVTTTGVFALGAGSQAFGSSTNPTPDSSCTAAQVGKTANYVSPTGLKHDVLTCTRGTSGNRWQITSSTTTKTAPAPTSTNASTGTSSSASGTSGSTSSSPYGSTRPSSIASISTPKPAKYVPVQKTSSYKLTNGQPHSRLCTRKADPTSATANGPWWCYLMS